MWFSRYPFSIGDLKDSAVVLSNYMENSGGGKIPWADLRYIFGEIMYGGHIVNDFDRKMCNTYLGKSLSSNPGRTLAIVILTNPAINDHNSVLVEFFMRDDLLDEMEMFPYNDEEKSASYMSPSPSSYDKYLEHIDNNLTQDTPIAFGMHPNAEIEFRTTQSNRILVTIMELQPRDAGMLQ